jgi:hypothetical protein
VTVVCVTGPVAGGRTRVVDRLRVLIAANTHIEGKIRRSRLLLRPCVWATPDTALVQAYPARYRLMTSVEEQLLKDTSKEPAEYVIGLKDEEDANQNNGILHKDTHRNFFEPDSEVVEVITFVLSFLSFLFLFLFSFLFSFLFGFCTGLSGG